MRLFSRLYDMALRWAAHPKAERYLALLSFAESSFFPIPPDAMLAPMALAERRRAWRYAAVTTIASVLGGLAGYAIGALAFDLIGPWLQDLGQWDKYLTVREWFERWGFWAVFLAGFTPIPYKLFTIAAGVIFMPLVPFILASLIGRGGRFFLVAGIIVVGGEPMEKFLRRYVDIIGWIMVAAAVALYFFLR